MILLNDNAIGRCPGHLKLLFVRLCALTVFLWLVIYAFSLVNMEAATFSIQATSETESWNSSSLLHTAIHKLQNAMMLPQTQRKRKLVLLWTSYYSKADWLPSTQHLQCPVSDCDVTSNRSLLNRSSALVLHWRSLDDKDLPKCDTDHCPLWVLFNKESPPHTSKDILNKIQDRVHWTATYRLDSDIYAPYGKVVKRKGNSLVVPGSDTDRRQVCWLVSNCHTHSKRELFVHELQKHIEVDMYGRCGTQKCPHEHAKDCYQWLSKRCKFYLSLENSNCRDYITEKLFYAMSYGMVPIVMDKNSNYAAQLPPKSYINVADFSSPKELANHLVTIGENQTMYQSYHWWRTHYEVIDFAYRWLCELCKKLHNNADVLTTVKPGKNLMEWWFDQSGCMS